MSLPFSRRDGLEGSGIAGTGDALVAPIDVHRGSSVERETPPRRQRFGMLLVLTAVFVLAMLLLSAALTSRALDMGRRDITLIERVHSLEAVTAQIAADAEHYLRVAPRDYPDYYRDTEIYYRALQRQLEQVEDLRAQLTRAQAGFDRGPLAVWGGGGRGGLGFALEEFDRFWTAFREGLSERLGPDPAEPRLEWGAQYLQREAAALGRHVEAVSQAARTDVERHFRAAERAGRYGMMLAFALAALAVIALVRTAQRRLAVTVEGCGEIARGHFGHQIPVARADELTMLDEAVNRMSERVGWVLRLIDEVQKSQDLDTTLLHLRQILAQVSRVDSLALYEFDRDRSLVELRGQHPGRAALPRLDLEGLPDQPRDGPWVAPLVLGEDECEPARSLSRNGFAQALWLLVPMAGSRGLALLLASRDPSALGGDLPELLGQVAAIIGHGLDKILYSERLLLATVNGLGKLAESRDSETGDHLLRMSEYSRLLAEAYVLFGARNEPDWNPDASAEFIRDVHCFAPLHDIGKVGIPDSILLKPDKLDDIERAEMSMHPLIGGEVLRACAAQLPGRGPRLFKVAIEIAEGHHERFDGSGYPIGLAGKEIPLAARIVALADVFDALTSKRPYKEPWAPERALAYVREQAGRHFDPDLVEAFETVLPAVMKVYGKHRHV